MSYDNSHTTDRLQQPDLPETASAVAPEAPAPQQDNFANAAWKPDSHHPPINPDPVIRQTTPAPFPRDGDYPPINPDPVVPQMVPAQFPRDSDYPAIAPQPDGVVQLPSSAFPPDHEYPPLPSSQSTVQPTDAVPGVSNHAEQHPSAASSGPVIAGEVDQPGPGLGMDTPTGEGDATQTGEDLFHSADEIEAGTVPPPEAAARHGAAGTGDDPADGTVDSSQHLDGESPAVSDTPRYSADDLHPTGLRGTRNDRELFADPTGELHCPGDRVGTWRDTTGWLQDENGYVKDDNKAPRRDIEGPSVPGPSAVDIPTDGDAPTARAVRDAHMARDAAATAKEDIWRNEVEPIGDRLREVGINVDRNTFGSEVSRKQLAGATDLTRAERLAARIAMDSYVPACGHLVRASEQLGVAGGNHAAAMLFPNARTITAGDANPGTSGNFDRVLLVPGDPPAVIVMEDKGAGSTLGTRLVPHPDNPGGPKIKAEQCSPEYVAGVLPIDNKIAAELRAQPGLRPILQDTINGLNGGLLRCFLAHTSARGKVTVTEYLLDARRLRRETIRLPGSERITP